MIIKAVFFDAGNTLIEPVRPPALIYREVFQTCGLDVSEGDITRVFRETWDSFNAMFDDGRDKFAYYPGGEKVFWREYVSRVMRALGPVRDFDRCFEELYAVFRDPETWRPYPEVIPTLRKLMEKDVPLGIVSNWDSSLKSILKALDLARYFRIILISSLVGVAKPDPRIFALAARSIGVTPKVCLHVGDHPGDDVRGAQGAGFTPLLLDRAHRFDGKYPSIQNVTEVFGWLR